jgi:hypothetical protein
MRCYQAQLPAGELLERAFRRYVHVSIYEQLADLHSADSSTAGLTALGCAARSRSRLQDRRSLVRRVVT